MACLKEIPEEYLDKSCCFIMELHGLSLEHLPFLEKISKKFTLFHAHGNNIIPNTITIDGKIIPRVLEVTYINNRYITSKSVLEQPLPHNLEVKCAGHKPEHILNYWLK